MVNVCEGDVQLSVIGLALSRHALMLRMRNLVSFLLLVGRSSLRIAGGDADSSSPSSGRNWLQLVFPERFCQAFDRLRSYSPYKSFVLCHFKYTCFSRRASILYHPSLNKAMVPLQIGDETLTAPGHRMLGGWGKAFVVMGGQYLKPS